eukprot:COSAG02_NODE_51426_length_314_cov_0.725581_1_plen_75_part_10
MRIASLLAVAAATAQPDATQPLQIEDIELTTAGIASSALPHRTSVLAAGQLAFRSWALERPRYNVGPDFDCTEGM